MTLAEVRHEFITPDSPLWRELIEQGKRNGYITYDDILSRMPALEHNLDLLDELLDALSSEGVEVVPDSPARSAELNTSDELAEVEAGEEILDPAILYEDLIQDAGYQQALETDDVVGLYLKEAGRVPLLTAEEEVALAKRMEAGQFAAEQLEEMADYLTADERAELETLVADAEAAQEYLVRANSRLVISVAKK